MFVIRFKWESFLVFSDETAWALVARNCNADVFNGMVSFGSWGYFEHANAERFLYRVNENELKLNMKDVKVYKYNQTALFRGKYK